jgi:hypothetical protein
MNQTNNKLHSRKYALTGKLRSGKDFAASLVGGTILSFADPFYKVGKSLFGLGVEAKDDPKASLRKFYQNMGEWGKGTVDEQHPITMERANFIMLMRAFGPQLCPDVLVDWRTYGHNKNIWLESLLARAMALTGELHHSMDFDDAGNPVSSDVPREDIDVFVTNVRFRHELTELRQNDFDHFHSMCSEATYIERLRQVGITLGDQRLKHVSEMLANELDREVMNILRLHPTGPKLKVIWNDDRPSPSDRLFSLDEFKTYVENNAKEHHNQTTGPVSQTEETPKPDAAVSSEDLGHDHAEGSAGSTEDRKPSKGSRARKHS